MSVHIALFAAAACCFIVFLLIGTRVSAAPLGALDERAIRLRGQATRVAVVFTKSGRSKGVTAACVIAIAVFIVAQWPLWIPLVMILSQILSQTIVELLKRRFARTRPHYWLVGLEAGHSYPSGHATTAVVFFVGWALVTALSPLPYGVKYLLGTVLTLWAAGVSWSRLALGAHYVSDVFGGWIFGAGWLFALFGVFHPLVRLP